MPHINRGLGNQMLQFIDASFVSETRCRVTRRYVICRGMVAAAADTQLQLQLETTTLKTNNIAITVHQQCRIWRSTRFILNFKNEITPTFIDYVGKYSPTISEVTTMILGNFQSAPSPLWLLHVHTITFNFKKSK